MDLDYGISLDPLAVPQRHFLEEDSDGEEEIKVEPELTFPATAELGRSSNVILAIGLAASIFTRSFLNTLHDSPYQILSDSVEVFKDKSFPTSSDKVKDYHKVSEIFGLESKGGKTYSLCVQELQVKSQHCHNWCSKVILGRS